MHPPFGFALFYLRSVAPQTPYVDKVTGRTMPPVTTAQIYWGAVPFVLIQCAMVALLIAFPGLVRHETAPAAATERVRIEAPLRQPDASSGGGKIELPPYPPAIPGAPPPVSSGPGAPTLDMSVPPVTVRE
jgi:hypothetical protein